MVISKKTLIERRQDSNQTGLQYCYVPHFSVHVSTSVVNNYVYNGTLHRFTVLNCNIWPTLHELARENVAVNCVRTHTVVNAS